MPRPIHKEPSPIPEFAVLLALLRLFLLLLSHWPNFSFAFFKYFQFLGSTPPHTSVLHHKHCKYRRLSTSSFGLMQLVPSNNVFDETFSENLIQSCSLAVETIPHSAQKSFYSKASEWKVFKSNSIEKVFNFKTRF